MSIREKRKNFSNIGFLIYIVETVYNKLGNKIATIIWRAKGVKMGTSSKINMGVKINAPKKITIGDNCLIDKGCIISTEIINQGYLKMKNGVQINNNVKLDITGGIELGEGIVISSDTTIYTHDHGINPHSVPNFSKLEIGEHSWIGSHCIVMPQTKNIGRKVIIGSKSLVLKDCEEQFLYIGSPATKKREIH